VTVSQKYNVQFKCYPHDFITLLTATKIRSRCVVFGHLTRSSHYCPVVNKLCDLAEAGAVIKLDQVDYVALVMNWQFGTGKQCGLSSPYVSPH